MTTHTTIKHIYSVLERINLQRQSTFLKLANIFEKSNNIYDIE